MNWAVVDIPGQRLRCATVTAVQQLAKRGHLNRVRRFVAFTWYEPGEFGQACNCRGPILACGLSNFGPHLVQTACRTARARMSC